MAFRYPGGYREPDLGKLSQPDLFLGSAQKFAACLQDKTIMRIQVLCDETVQIGKKLVQEQGEQGTYIWKLKAGLEKRRQDAFAGRFREQWLR